MMQATATQTNHLTADASELDLAPGQFHRTVRFAGSTYRLGQKHFDNERELTHVTYTDGHGTTLTVFND